MWVRVQVHCKFTHVDVHVGYRHVHVYVVKIQAYSILTLIISWSRIFSCLLIWKSMIDPINAETTGSCIKNKFF